MRHAFHVGVLALIFLSFCSFSQTQSVAIGTTVTDPGAVLLLVGNNSQGLAIPTSSNVSNVPKRAGMIVFSTSDNKVYYCDGTNWAPISGGVSGTDSQTLQINGNSISISNGNSQSIAGSPPTAIGQVLLWDGAKWTSNAGTAAPSPNQILQWNGTTWAPATFTGGGDMVKTTYDTNNDGIVDAAASVNLGTQAANSVLVGPASGAAAAPTFRALTVADLPNIDVSKITTGTLGIARGGTNSIAAPTTGGVSYGNGTAFAFTAAGTAGQVLQSNGAAAPTWINLPGTSGTAGGDLSGTYPNPTISASPATGGNIITSINAASTSILGTRVNPTFGTQNIITTGTLAAGATSVTGLSIGTSVWPANATGALTNNGAGVLSWTPALSNPMTTVGDIIIGGASGAASRLAGSAGFLKSTGAAAPAWSPLAATDIPTLDATKITTGILPVSVGGTGRSTWNGILFGSGGTLSDVTIGTPGQVLGVSGTSPNWSLITSTNLDPAINIATTGSGTFGTLTATGNITFNSLVGTGTRVLTANASGQLVAQTITQDMVPKGDGTTGLAASDIYSVANNIGIGTASPDTKFTVENTNNYVASFRSAQQQSWIGFYNSGTNYVGYVGTWNSPATNSFDVGTGSSNSTGDLNLVTQATPRVTVDPAGNVGIATTSPTSALEINGFTKLGSSAPAIKTALLTGTTASSEGALTNLSFAGITTRDKIVSITVMVDWSGSGSDWIQPNWVDSQGFYFNWLVNSTTNLAVVNVLDATAVPPQRSNSILNKAIRAFITYIP